MTVSSTESDYLNQNWTNLRDSSIIVPVDGWTKIRQYMLETCKENNNCPEALQKKIQQIDNLVGK